MTMIPLLAFIISIPKVSHSVPSFARQTGLACSSCHTVFPELNSLGRIFKLNGYTLSSDEAIESKAAGSKINLKLPKTPPFSAMLQASGTHLKTRQPGTQNNNISFPQQFSFFFAGEITPNLGGFVQVTWDDQSSAFDFDMLDFRYSRPFSISGKDLIFGLTLNNNPTSQDVWNSTPAWGFPYASSGIAPTPGATPLIAGGLENLEQSFAGLGAYGFYNNMLYGEFTLYHSTPHGSSPNPPDSTSINTSKNIAPYWRLALQHQWPQLYLAAGTYGFSGRFFPIGISGSADRYTDIGIDMQASGSISSGVMTAHGTWLHESRDLAGTFSGGGAEFRKTKINLFRADANYYFEQRYGIAIGYFAITGDRDTLLYAPSPVSGFRANEPNSNGIILELNYLPWLNTKLSLQYVIYGKFNGAKDNYDGSGRKASDNNTAYILAWFAM